MTEFTNKTAFGVNEKFEDLGDKEDISTEQFLKACVDMTTIVGKLTSPSYS